MHPLCCRDDLANCQEPSIDCPNHRKLGTIAGLEVRTVDLIDTTTLNLLTREEVATCRFETQLSAEQYDSLFKFVRCAKSRQELESYLLRFADK